MLSTRQLVITALLFCTISSTFLWAADPQYVQVKEVVVRDKASSLGKALGTIAYTTAVSVLQKVGSWVRISCIDPKLTGWISASALTVKNLGLKAGSGGSSTASSNEVALAGKGFNDQVETEYRAQNSTISYEWVDKMEQITVSDDDLAIFLVDGPKGVTK